jgi:hypothetical protein
VGLKSGKVCVAVGTPLIGKFGVSIQHFRHNPAIYAAAPAMSLLKSVAIR